MPGTGVDSGNPIRISPPPRSRHSSWRSDHRVATVAAQACRSRLLEFGIVEPVRGTPARMPAVINAGHRTSPGAVQGSMRSVERAAAILRLLAEQNEPIVLSQIALAPGTG